MQIYYFTAGVESDELTDLEGRLRGRLPALRKLAKLDEVTKRIAQQAAAPAQETAFIIFPVPTVSSFDRLVSIADQVQRGIFFIFVTKDISASDYKRLVRSGGADWVSFQNAAQEIEEIVLRSSRAAASAAAAASADAPEGKPLIMAFVASCGGAGNTTLAVETAVQLKQDKQLRQSRVCLLDLDLQTSHACDYLDIEARLKLLEIADYPDRLDEQLFELFVSHHASGLDVLAAPRNRNEIALSMVALDPLFAMIAKRYDVIILDLPAQWGSWTRPVLSVCNIVVVTGLNTVPGLRLVADTLTAVREVQPLPLKIVTVLNRCEPRLFGGVARGDHIGKMLGAETVLTVRADTDAAVHANNTGAPISISSPSNRIVKDVQAISALAKAELAVQPKR
jgi:pilus assembly protein CpaE